MAMFRKMGSVAEATGPQEGRALTRQEKREEASRVAREAVAARNKKAAAVNITQRVENAMQRLKGSNVGAAVSIIGSLSSHDIDAYLIAEKYGANRKGVLQQFPPVRKAALEAYRLQTEAVEAQPEG